jgi:hypothetical protein
MAHPTSVWADLFGLPDPAVPAQHVLDASVAALNELSGVFERVAAQAEDAGHLVTAAAREVREGWSAPTAVAAVEAPAVQFRDVQATCRGAGRAISSYAEGVPGYQDQVQDAYATADVTIVDQGLIPEPDPTAFGRFKAVMELRAYVVQQLITTVTAVSSRMDHAALALVSGTGPDPRDGLTMPGGHPTAPTAGPSSADVDVTNRSKLAADLSSPSATTRAFARSIQQALQQAAAQGNTVQLLSYDPTEPAWQGGVAIAIGDVTQADTVSVLVPGIDNSPSDAAGSLRLAADLAHATERAAPGTSAATVVYLAYDIPWSASKDTVDPRSGLPDWLGAAGDIAIGGDAADAAAGGAMLAGFVDHLRLEMNPAAGLTLVGHSYGSTVVSEAATVLGPGAGVNDIVLLASPGAGYGVHSADDYDAVPADHVYALAFPGDPVTSDALDGVLGMLHGPIPVPVGGPFGPDPVDGFGAQVIDVPPSVPLITGPSVLQALTDPVAAGLAAGAVTDGFEYQHAMTNYLSGAALAAVAAVAAGRYAHVPVKPGR